MRIDMKFDTSALKVKTEREAKRLAFNTALALNETAKAIQLEERANLDRKFTIRKATFMYRLIKIFTFASARLGRPFAEIGIDSTKSRVLLGLFEKGGEKKPFIGRRVAVPVTGGPARPSFRQSVAAAFRFTALRLRPKRRGRGPRAFHPRALQSSGSVGGQLVGAQDTFSIRGRGIFQRVGDVVKAVYLFVKRPRLDHRLDFVKIARATAAREWAVQFKKAYRR